MSRTFDPTTTDAIAAKETSEVFLALLKIDNADLSQPFYLVNNTEEIITTPAHPEGAQTWLPYPFSVTPPEEQADGVPSTRLSIDPLGFDQAIIAAVRRTIEPIVAAVYVVRAAAPDDVLIGLADLAWRNITYSIQPPVISGDLMFPENFTDEPFPGGRITPSNFPGVF